MEKHVINMENYPRRAHFDYFKNLAYPYLGITSNVDITQFVKRQKSEKTPFFLSFLYEVSEAVNQIPEFRQRIVGNTIVEYTRCDTSHTVAKADGTFAYCRLQSNQTFQEFLPYAMQQQEKTKHSGTIEEGVENESFIFISTLPWLEYTTLIQPTPVPADSNPRITWGKYFYQDQQILMPVTVLVNHALVDGKHIADFYRQLEERIK